MSDMNIAGYLADIEEDDGYERMDLVMTVVENIVTDVLDCMNTEDKDKLYALTALVNRCSDYELMSFLPNDFSRSPYVLEYCGEYRVDGSRTINVSDMVNLNQEIK